MQREYQRKREETLIGYYKGNDVMRDIEWSVEGTTHSIRVSRLAPGFCDSEILECFIISSCCPCFAHYDGGSWVSS
jgi:hypothetical protein